VVGPSLGEPSAEGVERRLPLEQLHAPKIVAPLQAGDPAGDVGTVVEAFAEADAEARFGRGGDVAILNGREAGGQVPYEVNLIFHINTAPVHHEVMIARFDKAARDEVEAEDLAAEDHSLWTARVHPKTQARIGRTVELAVDAGGFHFFDTTTGRAIGHPPTPSGNGSRSTS
jgi:hypothetical protein